MEQSQKIRELMVDYLVNQGGIAPEVAANGAVKLEDLGVDSLSLVEMLYEIEDKHGVRVENLAVLKDMTIDAMVDFLNGLVNSNKVAA